jgi:hypothetical protein
MRTLVAAGITTLAVVGAAGIGTISVSAMQNQHGQANGTGTPSMAQNGQGNRYGATNNVETQAKVLGTTAEQLRTQLQTKTMDQVRDDAGMTQDQFRDKMQAERQASGDCDGDGEMHQYAGNRHES